MKPTTLSFLIVFFVGQITLAQETEIPSSFSLKEAQDYAVLNSYNAKSAEMDLRKAQQKVNETRAIGLPQVNGQVEFQDFLTIPTTVIPANTFDPSVASDAPDLELPFGVQYNINAGVTVSQLIFNGSYLVGLQAAKTYVAFAENSKTKSEIEIRNEVTKAYANFLIIQENEKVLKESVATLQKLADDAQALFNNGFNEQTDVDQLQLTLTSVKNNLRNIGRQKELVNNLLKFTMGIPIANEIGLTNDLKSIVTINNNPAYLEQTFDVNNHIDYRSILINEEVQTLIRKQASSGYLPSLSAFYNYRQSYNRANLEILNNDWFPTSLLGVTLDVPIFSSFSRKNQVEQAKVEVERAVMQKEQVSQSLNIAAEQAKTNYSNALDTYNTEKQNLAIAKRIKENTFLKYKEGLASSFDLNNAQNQELTTQGNYISSMQALVNAKTALDKALGNYNQ